MADVGCDTTDIYRESDPYGAVLSVLLYDDRYVDPARRVAKGLLDQTSFF